MELADTVDLESTSKLSVGSNPTKDIKMYIISNKTVSYYFKQNKKLFGLVLSSYKGWGILLLKQDFFLIKKNELYPIVLASKSYLTLLTVIFLGFYRGYFKFLKLKGMGYRFINIKNNIIFKFGFSHRIIYINYVDIYCLFISKYILRFESRSLWLLTKVINCFKNIRKNNVYKKKGIFFKGFLISIKISSKKSKF